jgi:hypothetical protein
MNKRIMILFLMMCIMGFTMSPVNAEGTVYKFYGEVGDIFEVLGDSDMNNDLASAYMESGLFDVHRTSKFDGQGNVIYHYKFKAVIGGWEYIEINDKGYIFDIWG